MNRLKERVLANRLILSKEFYDQAGQFARMLLRWGRIHNITGAKNEKEIAAHIFDSLFPLTFLEDFQSALDIGSGAGFPALVLSMAKPRAHFTLVEPLAKRAAFLQFAANTLRLENVTVLDRRVEQAPPVAYDLITSRAVGSAKMVRDLARPFMGERSTLLLYKGGNTAREAQTIGAKTISAPHASYLLYEPRAKEAY
ncbi:MAG: 16S rRNA (guanine(527)-N(7))-methyltransferase RsmG [Helicobacteraceae bacterium]|jgi:16S rRNA (guanine527-N7)-methyltransferase|nr:16S rRNA (guanine(527)-N(7))-methyltransferase RsmG [Helicobacteraceae bacterium]